MAVNSILFFNKVIKSSSCWNWVGALRGKTGYGCLKVDGKVIDSHRASWMLHNGKIPDGLWVLHKCDNRRCVNPEHLFLGDRSANMKDCANKGRLHFQKNKDAFTKLMQDRFGVKVKDNNGNIYNSMGEFLREKGLKPSGGAYSRIREGYKNSHDQAKAI